MSYYVNMQVDLIIKDVKNLKKLVEKEKELNENRFFCNILDIEEEDKDLEFDEYLINFDQEEFDKFVESIKKYVEGDIYCTGEIWDEKDKYEFIDGNVECKQGTIHYGFDAYEEFIKKYKKELPNKLLKELKKWNVARKL